MLLGNCSIITYLNEITFYRAFPAVMTSAMLESALQFLNQYSKRVLFIQKIHDVPNSVHGDLAQRAQALVLK
jgi:hypothetical protein